MCPDDVLPSTLVTWIADKLLEGNGGRLEVNRHVMETYAAFLRRYLRGSSFARLGDADELVDSFFADRLARQDYFTKWQKSGKRLRYWLVNGLVFSLKEMIRGPRPPTPLGDLPEESLAAWEVSDPDQDLERAFVIELVRRALEDAGKACEAEGLGDHWRIFVRHNYEGLSYEKIREEMGIPVERASVMNRTAKLRFQKAVRELIARDGAGPHEVDSTIRSLL